ncbi:glycosyltransferase involved in cell wall biosynthesis [Bradyrhizobium sp. i1.8.4]
MIEAMACGTPVIAYRAGSVPEVVDEGLTGFILENEAEAVQAVKDLPGLDRRKVRARFEERFTSDRMARAYETHYRRLLAARPAHLSVVSEHLGTPASPLVP